MGRTFKGVFYLFGRLFALSATSLLVLCYVCRVAVASVGRLLTQQTYAIPIAIGTGVRLFATIAGAASRLGLQ